MVNSKKTGKIIIPFGVFPERHELETASVFLAKGFDVEFIMPNRTRGSKTPDVKIDGTLWEMKTPMGKSKNTIYNALRRGAKQSKHIVIDLRYTKIPDEQAVKDLQFSLSRVKSIKRILVIMKSSEITTLAR